MATIFRDLSYRYQWLYDSISRLAAVTVGGEARFRRLALENLQLEADTQILDLCCGSGHVTRFLVDFSNHVTGLDASPLSIQRSQKNVPKATYIQAFAEDMPFADNLFDVVHTSAALHEMQPEQLRKIIMEVYRVLKPGGVFTLIDFHPPTNPLFWPGLAVFFWLFETETAWELLRTDLPGLLTDYGFDVSQPSLYAGGSLQVIQGKKMVENGQDFQEK
ncbi:class I SAM-dependent methyltransferase [Dolichospermum circinale]|uniref:class I SAM-dependent methyltransferase n=1 Tax=Dolichospermum circinale TaxID=109265 RepID=UPI000419156F|nr:class I SAM-dependent methyltransferase [Dolichospermum circinale]MDB9475364.1 class I SAM-dependent methyltransferase [Dolichospermum circinale CS-537/11]MDB9478209.1 class I SAM-dependent methyltransferase [Dolichospermum circinale CS-537/03]MDB9481814.1 class I SAM-dependent methyltransferase [Dolichospermum circinale CS-537/05]